MARNDLLAIGLLVAAFMSAGGSKSTVTVPVPSEKHQARVADIRALVSGKPAAPVAASLFSAAAEVIRRDDGARIKSTLQVSAWLSDASTLRLQGTDLAKSIPGLSKALDKAIIEAIGNKTVAMTPELRTELIATLEAIAWACG